MTLIALGHRGAMTRSRALVATAGLSLSALLLTACGGLSDEDRERAEEAALAAVGDGRVTEVDEGDDDETAAFNVEVALDSGQDVDVELDEDFEVLNQGEIDTFLADQSGSGGADDGGATESPAPDDGVDDGADDGTQGDVDDDTPLEGRIKQQAERAALDEVGEGRVTESTYADRDEDHVYEVEVETGSRDDDVTVELDRDFGVVRVDR